MPPQSRVPKTDAINVIKKFMQYFTTNEYPAYTSNVWVEMSKELGYRWNAHNVYVSVRENRRNILSIARAELGIVVEPNDVRDLENSDNSSNAGERRTVDTTTDDSGANNNACSGELMKFHLILTQEEWDMIKPNGTVRYGDREKYDPVPWIWTHTMSVALWRQKKLPCAFVYTRVNASLSSDGCSYSLTLQGSCKDKICGNKIDGRGEKRLDDDQGLIILVCTHDTRNILHEPAKRPLKKKRRKQAQREPKSKERGNWRRSRLNDDDVKSPVASEKNVLRMEKSEEDLIGKIEDLSLTKEYAGVIHSVGSLPFFVFYSTPAEMDAYKKYCRVCRGASTIFIDATGSFVRKLMRNDGRESGPIFMHSIVVNFKNTILAVHHILSETHETEILIYWLMAWFRLGAPKPNVVVCDYSRALISAVCLAFNNITVKSYIDELFSIAAADYRPPFDKPETLIRIDVAHLTRMICRWKCFDSSRKTRVKDFFVRCVSLMVDCRSISQFGEIFRLTCAVGLQTHEDTKIEINEARTPKQARMRLDILIAERKIEVIWDGGKKINDQEKPDYSELDVDEIRVPGSPVSLWLQEQIEQAKNTVQIGINPNPFYLPDFIEQLYKLAEEFPLWTCATILHDAPQPSFSAAEAYFRDLKANVFTDIPRPMPIDKFIKVQVLDIIDQTSIFSSKINISEQRARLLQRRSLKNSASTGKNSEEPIVSSTIFADGIEKSSYEIISKQDFEIREQDFIPNESDLMKRENSRTVGSIGDADYFSSDDPALREYALSSSIPNPTSLSVYSSTQNSTVPFIMESLFDRSNVKIEEINIAQDDDQQDHSYCKIERTNILQAKTESPFDIEESWQNNDVAPSSPIESSLLEAETIKANDYISASSEMTQRPVIKIHKLQSTRSKPYPEIPQMNLLASQMKKSLLLQNGSCCKLPLMVDGNKIIIKKHMCFKHGDSGSRVG